jgi:uncharacterized membrane protein YkgB
MRLWAIAAGRQIPAPGRPPTLDKEITTMQMRQTVGAAAPGIDAAVARVPAADEDLPGRLARAGTSIARYGVALVLAWIGLLKFTPAEAAGIRPLIEHSPFMSWMYGLLSVQGVSNLIGTLEIAAALLIVARPVSPRAAVAGSAFAVLTFLGTLSFMATTPGVFELSGGFVHLSGAGQFLIKDIVFLGASLWSLGEALDAARRDAVKRAVPATA